MTLLLILYCMRVVPLCCIFALCAVFFCGYLWLHVDIYVYYHVFYDIYVFMYSVFSMVCVCSCGVKVRTCISLILYSMSLIFRLCMHLYDFPVT